MLRFVLTLREIVDRKPLVRLNGPRGGLWWCETCGGGGFLDHPPIGAHRVGCALGRYV